MSTLVEVRPLLVLAPLLAVVGACDADDGRQMADPIFPAPVVATTVPAVEVTEPMTVFAPWAEGAAIPARHTCEGDDLSPALTWTNVPGDAVELAVVLTDVDAPGTEHWVLTGLAPDTTGLAEGAGSGYVGPCPPAGETHRYAYTVYALNQQYEGADDPDVSEVIQVLGLTSIGQASVTGAATGTG